MFMKTTKLIPLALIVAALSGCATNYGAASSSDVSKAMVVKDSSFDAVATYIGPQAFSETSRGLFVDNETAQLVASRNKTTGELKYAVFVRILYTSSWRFYQSASFRDGSQKPLRSLSKQTNACQAVGCIHTEEVALDIDKDLLTKGGDLEFRLNSQSGAENVIKVPSSYIAGFVAGLPPGFIR
jgi:hypothetical protein